MWATRYASWWVELPRGGCLSMPQSPRPCSLIAELSYQCPLHCPYCSNPVDIGHPKYSRAHLLATEDWVSTFEQARGLGGLHSSLITAGTLFTRERARALKDAGLDHVQISFQSPDAEENDRIAGNRSFEKKGAAGRAGRDLGFPF